MEKVGGMLHNEKVQEAGSEKRAKAGGFDDNGRGDSYGGDDSYGSGSRSGYGDNGRGNYWVKRSRSMVDMDKSRRIVNQLNYEVDPAVWRRVQPLLFWQGLHGSHAVIFTSVSQKS